MYSHRINEEKKEEKKMKAIVYDLSIPRYLLSAFLNKRFKYTFFKSVSCVSFKENIEEPTLPGQNWVKIKTKMSGICGSDLNAIFGKESFSMEPFSSFPAVLGHENFGEIIELGSGISHLRKGDRVVVEPILCCEARGIEPPCSQCKNGNYNLCQNFAHGHVSPGAVVGFNKTTGGGWGEYFVAHQSQCFKVPASVTNMEATMTDCLASAMQPVIHHYPKDNETVIVYGCGIIGINTIQCLRALGSRAKIIALYRHTFQGEMAKKAGADEIIRTTKGIYELMSKELGSKLLRPSLGPPVMVGGADQIFDCVGSDTTIDQSLRWLKGKGKLVLVATSGNIKKVDISPVWFQEIVFTGSSMYSYSNFFGERKRVYDIVLELIENKKFPVVESAVTHQYSISQFDKAIQVALNKKEHQSMKVVFTYS